MRVIASLLIGAALAATSAVAATPQQTAKAQAKLEKALEGRVAGKPVNCISLSSIQSTQIIDGTAILYRTSGNRLYVNRPAIGASSLDDDDILVTRTSMSQLCNVDVVHLIDRTGFFQHGFVGLGEFVPYTKAAPKS
jgi:hypothetical protein